MKKFNQMIITGLLAFNIYAGDDVPTNYYEYYDSNNWVFGETKQSIEDANVDKIIDARNINAAVVLNNVTGTYLNLSSASIWGRDYGLFSINNDTENFSALSIDNYGNISSDNRVGINMVGISGQLNNYQTGSIFGGTIGVKIQTEAGNAIHTGFNIFNSGRIESTNLGIYADNYYFQDIYIENTSTGYIGGDIYGIVSKSFLTLDNQGVIDSLDPHRAAILLLDGGIIDNTDGIIKGNGSKSIESGNALVLKGSGQYEGDITYVGSFSAEDRAAKSNLRLSETNINFVNSRLRNWASISVDGGENHFNVETDQSLTTDVYLFGGAIAHVGDGTVGTVNIVVLDGLLNPYENNQDTGDDFYWDRMATQYDGGPSYYNKHEYEHLTVHDLVIGSNGGIIIDIKTAQPHYSYTWVYGDNPGSDTHTNPDGTYGGYGYAMFKGSPIPKYQRANHDTIDVTGTTTTYEGAILYLVDHTLESATESGFDTFSHLDINVFDGNISFDDFTGIEFYSDIYGLEELNNETGTAYLTQDAFVVGQKGHIDWWLKQASFGFEEAPVIGSSLQQSTTTVSQSGELLPYQISKVYSAKITQLDKTEALQNTIYTFQSWEDVDSFMDSINKLEYASLATSNLNIISNRVNQMFDRLSAGHMRDNNGLNIWGDVYFSDDSLDGTGNHGIDGHGVEFAAGLDKMFNDTTFGLSATYTDYTSTVNDDDVRTDIKSEGFGLNLYMMMDQGNLRHKAMLGYVSYQNSGDDVQDFDSSEMFASYRAEWTIKTESLEIKPFAGLRYSMVQFDEIREDADNGLKSFDQDSLESELGVKLVKQFKKLGVSVSGAWMHEFLDSQTTAEAFTSFGNFSQDGIARDTDSFRITIGFEYKLSEKVTLDFDYAKELSDNSESDSVNGKITFRF